LIVGFKYRFWHFFYSFFSKTYLNTSFKAKKAAPFETASLKKLTPFRGITDLSVYNYDKRFKPIARVDMIKLVEPIDKSIDKGYSS